MAQFKDDLGTMIGEIRNLRPLVGDTQVRTWLNWRVRQALDQRTFWADLLAFGNLAIPAPYTTGTVSVNPNDATVVGDSTAWPTNDVVNTTLSAAIDEIGYPEITPVSMSGIAEGGLLYLDAAGAPEIVPVIEKRTSTFVGKVTALHSAGATLTQSSLANRQFRISESYPIFTIAAVTSTTALELTLPWGGTALAAQTYTARLIYVVLSQALKAIIAMKDEATGYPVRLHVPLEEADYRDPKRTMTTGNPWYSLVDLGANDQGSMLYELWPSPSSARQFSYAYSRQWPQMVIDGDRPPWFINPSVFVYGALADAFRFKQAANDPYYNPALADHYEGRYREGVELAKNADEAKKLDALRNPWWKGVTPGNYDTWQLNDPAWAQFDFGYGGSY